MKIVHYLKGSWFNLFKMALAYADAKFVYAKMSQVKMKAKSEGVVPSNCYWIHALKLLQAR